MKPVFIAAIHGLTIQGILGRGLRLLDSQFLTNDPSQVQPLLSAHFERVVGALETDTIRNASALVYGYPDLNKSSVADSAIEALLIEQLTAVYLFLTALWLVKDNAANVEIGFIDVPPAKGRQRTISSQWKAIRFSMASGQYPIVEFTDTEVRTARDVFAKLFGKTAIRSELDPESRTVPGHLTRLDRVFYFSETARAESDLGMKIAAYVTCFEALFCTDSAELAYKLAERLAFFCRDTPADRLSVFNSAKTAYGIRSRTVHGDKLSAKQAAHAKEVAISCDSLLRTTLIKILTKQELYDLFTGSPERLDEFLTRLVFGAPLNHYGLESAKSEAGFKKPGGETAEP